METSVSPNIIKPNSLSVRGKLIFSLLANQTDGTENRQDCRSDKNQRKNSGKNQNAKEKYQEVVPSRSTHNFKEKSDEVTKYVEQSSRENEILKEAMPPAMLKNTTENENIQEVLGESVEDFEVGTDGMLLKQTNSSDNNEQMAGTSNIENEVSVQQENNIQEIIGAKTMGKKIRKRKPDISRWEMNENKAKRMKGEEYKGLKKSNGKWSYDQPRRARKMKPVCNCKHSRHDSKIKCNLFTEEERQNIFKRFWQELNWEQRKIYVTSLIDCATPKDKKNMKQAVSRRGVTLFYHLKKSGIRVRVCKKMFINTLDIGEWSTNSWALLNKPENNPGIQIDNNDLVSVQPEAILRKSNKRFTKRKNNLKCFFDSLPKMESHYCRASSQRLYLEPLWQSKLSLYNEYVKFCQKKKIIDPLSTKVFFEQFEENKLSLFRPRKDQCDVCVSHKAGNIADDVYSAHIDKKNRARQEKEYDKENASNVFTVDMQSVLLCPMLKASSIYYKKKLVVHNYTIYNLKTNDGFCFLWHEGEGGVTSNEFATILYDFIENKSGVKSGEEIAIFSDGCGYQNRNVTLSNALLHLSKKMKINIMQKYLVSGHTQMECDSMHSTIERKLRNQEIYTPAGYISACKLARRRSKPYFVEYLRHTYFKNYSKLSFFTSIRPGVKVGDPTVNNLGAFKYTDEGLLFFKINFNDDWLKLTKRNNKQVLGTEEIPQLYEAPLAIKKSKYEHLQELKKEIPHDYHLFYDTLKNQ